MRRTAQKVDCRRFGMTNSRLTAWNHSRTMIKAGWIAGFATQGEAAHQKKPLIT